MHGSKRAHHGLVLLMVLQVPLAAFAPVRRAGLYRSPGDTTAPCIRSSGLVWCGLVPCLRWCRPGSGAGVRSGTGFGASGAGMFGTDGTGRVDQDRTGNR